MRIFWFVFHLITTVSFLCLVSIGIWIAWVMIPLAILNLVVSMKDLKEN